MDCEQSHATETDSVAHMSVNTGTRKSSKRIVDYLLIVSAGNLVWEVGQLPLYTLWWTGTNNEILRALVHCTAGDVLIAAAALAYAIAAATLAGWRHFGARMIATTLIFGLAYTIFSEWLNVEVRHNWAYTPNMPIFPVLGTGIVPMLQWLIVPSVAFTLASRPSAGEAHPRSPAFQEKRV